MTHATASPTKRTFSAGSTGRLFATTSSRGRPVAIAGISLTSSAVSTSATPSRARAAAASTRVTFACANGLRRKAAWSVPGSWMSSTYLPRPRRYFADSNGGMRLPT